MTLLSACSSNTSATACKAEDSFHKMRRGELTKSAVGSAAGGDDELPVVSITTGAKVLLLVMLLLLALELAMLQLVLLHLMDAVAMQPSKQMCEHSGHFEALQTCKWCPHLAGLDSPESKRCPSLINFLATSVPCPCNSHNWAASAPSCCWETQTETHAVRSSKSGEVKACSRGS
jgi:hypothetical protein